MLVLLTPLPFSQFSNLSPTFLPVSQAYRGAGTASSGGSGIAGSAAGSLSSAGRMFTTTQEDRTLRSCDTVASCEQPAHCTSKQKPSSTLECSRSLWILIAMSNMSKAQSPCSMARFIALLLIQLLFRLTLWREHPRLGLRLEGHWQTS